MVVWVWALPPSSSPLSLLDPRRSGRAGRGGRASSHLRLAGVREKGTEPARARGLLSRSRFLEQNWILSYSKMAWHQDCHGWTSSKAASSKLGTCPPSQARQGHFGPKANTTYYTGYQPKRTGNRLLSCRCLCKNTWLSLDRRAPLRVAWLTD